MSTQTAHPESEPDDLESRARELTEEIEKKLAQAKSVCGVMMHMKDIDSLIADSLWTAESLIEDAEKAARELGRLLHAQPCHDTSPARSER
jgi:precorrin-6B methylase 1